MADTPADRMRAMRSHGSPTTRRAGEANAGANGDVGLERKVRITVDLPESLHKKLRLRVAQEGGDAQTLVRRLLAAELDQPH